MPFRRGETVCLFKTGKRMNVKTLCLGILNFGDATGYEIKKMSTEGDFSYFIDASFGSIYPALARLEHEGLISVREERSPGKPSKKIYSITDAGRQALQAALQDAPAPDKFKSEFLFLLLCCRSLPGARIRQLIDQRIEELSACVNNFQAHLEGCDHPGVRFTMGVGVNCMSTEIEYLKANRSWIESCGADAEAGREAAE